MSTSWNVECLDHPHASHMLDDDWSGSADTAARHLAELWRRRARLVQLQDLLPVDDDLTAELTFKGYRALVSSATAWIREHVDCRVELVNEYRDRLAIDSFEPQPPRHCRTCGCEPRTWT